MNTEIKWWRWPETAKNNRPPWFVILRRLTFLPIFVCGMTIAFLGIFFMYGKREALRWVRDES